MARILYIEDDKVACTAMEGIIRRSPHELIQVDSSDAAAKLLSEGVAYDIIVAELKSGGGNAYQLIRELRTNVFLKQIPVIVYSSINDKAIVKSVLDVGVQNYLFKPYKESVILSEITKHCAKSWQIKTSGAPKKFYNRLDTESMSLHGANQDLYTIMLAFGGRLKVENAPEYILTLREEIEQLKMKSERSAFPLLAEYLSQIMADAISGNISKMNYDLGLFPDAVRLQEYRLALIDKELHLNDEKQEEGGAVDEDEEEELEITRTLTLEEVEERIQEISSYPVIESAAASFQMSTHDDDTNLDEIVEMIQRDSGLATSVLRFANMSAIAPGAVIEDIHQAISVLGLKRVRLLALSLNTVPELSSMFTALKWEKFWMHQVGCAMLAEEISRRLDLNISPELIYIAGLIHDIGKILLNEVDKDLYSEVVAFSLANEVPLQTKEREHFGCSHEHVALIFAKNSNLSEALQACIEYQFEPENSPVYREVVSVLYLANYFCISYEVGDNGDRLLTEQDIAKHDIWKLLEPSLAPGFSVNRFIREIELRIRSLKIELSGMAEEQAKMRNSS